MNNLPSHYIKLNSRETNPRPLDHEPYTAFSTLVYITFLSYAADKQTDRQTDSKILLMPTDRVGVGNETRDNKDAGIYLTVRQRRAEETLQSDRSMQGYMCGNMHT